jgi:hypothetical protein
LLEYALLEGEITLPTLEHSPDSFSGS